MAEKLSILLYAADVRVKSEKKKPVASIRSQQIPSLPAGLWSASRNRCAVFSCCKRFLLLLSKTEQVSTARSGVESSRKTPGSTCLDLFNERNVIQRTGQQSNAENRPTCWHTPFDPDQGPLSLSRSCAGVTEAPWEGSDMSNTDITIINKRTLGEKCWVLKTSILDSDCLCPDSLFAPPAHVTFFLILQTENNKASKGG